MFQQRMVHCFWKINLVSLDSSPLRTVYNVYYQTCIFKIVRPELLYLAASSNIPHLNFKLMELNDLNIESYRGNQIDLLTEFECVQEWGFANSVLS